MVGFEATLLVDSVFEMPRKSMAGSWVPVVDGRQWRLCGDVVGRLKVASLSNELPALACYLAAAPTQSAESNPRLL